MARPRRRARARRRNHTPGGTDEQTTNRRTRRRGRDRVSGDRLRSPRIQATTTPSGTQQQQQQPTGGGPPDMSGLATELGVSAGELQAAMEKLRSAGGSPDDMAASLAKELGLTAAKVQEALEAARPQGAPPATGQPALPRTQPAPDPSSHARFAPAEIRRRGGEARDDQRADQRAASGSASGRRACRCRPWPPPARRG